MFHNITRLTFLVLAILVAGNSQAQPFAGRHHRGFGSQRMAAELNLRAEQKQALKCETPGQGREIRQEYFQERSKLNDLLRARSSSDAEILQQVETVNKLQAKWNKLRVEKIIKARQVLTPEQMEKLLNINQQEYGQIP
ncbi:MAG: periplasmic heavy metal sensor [Deltaproteobacteria bacterium]|nr:periplasmic heavy metal sensor [Deltaproteobacteria bacterium]